MFPSQIITIRNGHHYVDMNPSQTMKNLEFFIVDQETGEEFKLKMDRGLEENAGTLTN